METTDRRTTVSARWQERFTILDKIDGNLNKRHKELSPKDRNKVFFCIPAFIFGWIYYCVKGMWHKGLALAVMIGIGSLIGSYVLPERMAFYAPAVANSLFAALYAKMDYYHKICHDEERWEWMKNYPESLSSIPFLAICLILVLLASFYLTP